MIDIETLEREINELEMRGDTTYSMCERLAWLYIVRDHLLAKPQTQVLMGSEFLELGSQIDYKALMEILDEHMTALRTVFPAEYETVMVKIKSKM